MLEIVESDIPDIREFNPDVDEETVRILGRMLEKNPSDRYQSCDELNADLHRHPLATGPLQLKHSKPDEASKATMIGVPTPGTGGHRPPRGATPLPQVGARTQPVMAQPQVAPARPSRPVRCRWRRRCPRRRASWCRSLIAAVVVLGARRLWAQPHARRPGRGRAPRPPPPPRPPPQRHRRPPRRRRRRPRRRRWRGANAARCAIAATRCHQRRSRRPRCCSPRPGAVPVDPVAEAKATRTRRSRPKSRAASASPPPPRRGARRRPRPPPRRPTATTTKPSPTTTVAAPARSDAKALRKAYLCRTQHRC